MFIDSVRLIFMTTQELSMLNPVLLSNSISLSLLYTNLRRPLKVKRLRTSSPSKLMKGERKRKLDDVHHKERSKEKTG